MVDFLANRIVVDVVDLLLHRNQLLLLSRQHDRHPPRHPAQQRILAPGRHLPFVLCLDLTLRLVAVRKSPRVKLRVFRGSTRP